jgi:membrane-associated phospholipid phosphatase
MHRLRSACLQPVVASIIVLLALMPVSGCQTACPSPPIDGQVREALVRYQDQRIHQLAAATSSATDRPRIHALPAGYLPTCALGIFAAQEAEPSTQPTTAPASKKSAVAFEPPEGYWRRNIWHQMGHEAKDFGGRGFWRGFKTSFWDIENAAVLTATFGASLAIRGTGVDDTIRERTKGHRHLGDFDEPIQLLGHPGTHFAAAGVLWLGSALAKDVEQHEVAKSLGQALAVNGVSTMLLKLAANSGAPNGDQFAWPSGHTSSAFTVAAVLNEYYGPWVGVPSLALAGLVGYQRIDSRVHDFSDVVFGAMLGYVVGSSIAREEKAHFPELFGMQVVPYADPQTGATGLALYKQW